MKRDVVVIERGKSFMSNDKPVQVFSGHGESGRSTKPYIVELIKTPAIDIARLTPLSVNTDSTDGISRMIKGFTSGP